MTFARLRKRSPLSPALVRDESNDMRARVERANSRLRVESRCRPLNGLNSRSCSTSLLKKTKQRMGDGLLSLAGTGRDALNNISPSGAARWAGGGAGWGD